ncbi:MAG: uracil phosphoribosyltransferase [Bdellovibrionales bacterium]|nr:uracil phosphoribosyltransferase [Bdellovibrionales bacterium]
MSASKQIKDFCHVIDHPVLVHKLSLLRKKDTRPAEFRSILREISCLMAYEVTRDLKVGPHAIETPWEPMQAPMVTEKMVLLSILRAGNGMLGGMMDMLPFSKVGHIGVYRDKFAKATVEYYLRLPKEAEGHRVLVLDPLLATGDTAVACVDRLKEFQVGPIHFVCLLAAPVGIEKLKFFHPDVTIHTLSVERELDDKGYIRPGLGDAGDRLYDTV